MSDSNELSDLYAACQTAQEQIKRLKVRFKVRFRYYRLVHELACIIHCHYCNKDAGHAERHAEHVGLCCSCWAMHVLHRIERLGGDANSEIGDIVVTDDVKPALEKVLEVLQAVVDAAKAVESGKDHLSSSIAGEIQCAADKHIECIEAHLRQIKDLGDNYLLTLV